MHTKRHWHMDQAYRQWQWYWKLLRVNESKRMCDNTPNRLKAIHTQKYWKTRNSNKQLNNEVDDTWPNMLYSLTVLLLLLLPSMAKSPMSMLTDILFFFFFFVLLKFNMFSKMCCCFWCCCYFHYSLKFPLFNFSDF